MEQVSETVVRTKMEQVSETVVRTKMEQVSETVPAEYQKSEISGVLDICDGTHKASEQSVTDIVHRALQNALQSTQSSVVQMERRLLETQNAHEQRMNDILHNVQNTLKSTSNGVAQLESCFLEAHKAHEQRMTDIVQHALQSRLSGAVPAFPLGSERTPSEEQAPGKGSIAHDESLLAQNQGRPPKTPRSTSNQTSESSCYNQDLHKSESEFNAPKAQTQELKSQRSENSSKAQTQELKHVKSQRSELSSQKDSIRKGLQASLENLEDIKRIARTGSTSTASYWQDHTISGRVQRKSRFRWQAQRIVHSAAFDQFVGWMIFLNALVIAYQTERMVQNPDDPLPSWLHAADLVATIFFTAEIALRLSVEQSGFFRGPRKCWNIFDLLIVASALVEEFLRVMNNAMVIRVLRILRIIKVMRVVRTFQTCRDLRAMIQGILASLKAVVWAMALLMIIFFIFGIFLTTMVHQHLDTEDDLPFDAEVKQRLKDSFGSMGATTYSLYKAVTGGDDWSTFSDPLFELSTFVGLVFCFYIAFTVFAVINVITAVFVENAIKINARDADMIIMEQTAERKKRMNEVKSVFQRADADHSGLLTASEFQSHVDNVCVQAYFRQLDLDIEGEDATHLFSLLDFDGDGSIDIEEFIFGCGRLKGMAKSLDLARVEHQQRSLEKRIAEVIALGLQQSLHITTLSQSVSELCSHPQYKNNFIQSKSDVIQKDISSVPNVPSRHRIPDEDDRKTPLAKGLAKSPLDSDEPVGPHNPTLLV